MQDRVPDGIKILSLTKENDGLRSTIAELQTKNRKDKTKLLVLCSVLFIAALVLGIFYCVSNEGYNYAREEIASLSSELDVLQRKYNDLELNTRNADELEAENASLEKQIEEQEAEIASLEAALAVYSSGSSGSSSSGGTTSSTSDTQSVTVYITNTGSKYHKNGCQYLRESKNAVTLTQAKSWGYTACSRCY